MLAYFYRASQLQVSYTLTLHMYLQPTIKIQCCVKFYMCCKLLFLLRVYFHMTWLSLNGEQSVNLTQYITQYTLKVYLKAMIQVCLVNTVQYCIVFFFITGNRISCCAEPIINSKYGLLICSVISAFNNYFMIVQGSNMYEYVMKI